MKKTRMNVKVSTAVFRVDTDQARLKVTKGVTGYKIYINYEA